MALCFWIQVASSYLVALTQKRKCTPASKPRDCGGGVDGLPILLFLEISFFFVSLFNNLIYLFGCAGSSLLQGLFSSYLRVFFSWWCAGFSLRQLLLLGSVVSRTFGLQQLWYVGPVVAAPRLQSTGSVVEVHGHNFPSTCGIFLDQGSNPCLLHWQVDSLPFHEGSPEVSFFFFSLPFFLAIASFRRQR